MKLQKQKFDFENFKKTYSKYIKDLEYKRYTSLKELTEIKNILTKFYDEEDEVKKYFKIIGISYHFLSRPGNSIIEPISGGIKVNSKGFK